MSDILTRTDYLPPEIVSDILTRLPVKSLLRFRTVCNLWLTLIDSPDFVNSHLNRKSNTCALDFNQLDHSGRGYEFIGSSNGIVCLRSYCFGVTLLLWNPATRNKFMLRTPVSEFGFKYSRYCFGYDSVCDDYKIVRFADESKPMGDFDVDVFSLKSMSWTRFELPPYPVADDDMGRCFIRGALHWTVRRRTTAEDNLIVAFDLHNGDYQLLSHPKYPTPLSVSNIILFPLEGCLGMVCYYDKSCTTDVWIMKEYGVNNSWARLISVSGRVYLRPLSYSKNARRLLLDKDREILAWYDIKEKKFEETEIWADLWRYPIYSFLYVESLVQLPGSSPVGSEQSERE